MGSGPRPGASTRLLRRLANAGAHLALAGLLVLALPTATALSQEDATATRPVPLDQGSRPVRVRVPYFGIDLPVVWDGRRVPGNPAGYPLCDVAQYLVSKEQQLVLPGQPGTAWLYGHAQPGMFLPLTESYFQNGRNELTDKLMDLQLRDGRLLTYRISEVRTGFDYDIADRPNDRQQRLVLQTSTGSTGESPRLLVAGHLIDAEWTDEPRPDPKPRACWQPAPVAAPKSEPDKADRTTGGKNARQDRQSVAPTPAPVAEPDDELDPLTMLLGSGAVLLGATVIAVYIIRRP